MTFNPNGSTDDIFADKFPPTDEAKAGDSGDVSPDTDPGDIPAFLKRSWDNLVPKEAPAPETAPTVVASTVKMRAKPQKPWTEPVDTLTVLRAMGVPQSKTIKRNAAGVLEVEPRGANVKRWRGQELRVSDIHSLAAALEKVAGDRWTVPVRGKIKPGVDRNNMLRLKYDRPERGELATLDEVPHFYSLHDVDGLDCPFDPYADPAGTIAFVKDHMPAAFKDATCWYCFSSSAGLEPEGVFKVNVKLAFWHDKRLGEAELKTWMAPYPLCASAYLTVQVFYVNKPVISKGERDPLEGRCARSGVIKGASDVVITPEIPKAETVKTPWSGDPVDLPPNATLADLVELIGDHEGGLGCNEALKKVLGIFWQRFPNGNAAELEATIRRRFAEAEWDDRHGPGYRQKQLANLPGFIKRIYDLEHASLRSGLEAVTLAPADDADAVVAALFGDVIGPDGTPTEEPARDSTGGRRAMAVEKFTSRGPAQTKDGKALNTLANAAITLTHADLAPAFNELKMQVEFRAEVLPWEDSHGRVLNEHTLRILVWYLTRLYVDLNYTPSKDHVFEAVMTLALAAKFNPVLEWVDTLKWDGVPRIEKLFGEYFNCGVDDYTRGVSKCFAVGALRRQRQPGVKFDTMPIFQSEQGWEKSTGLQALFGADWFSDASLGNLKDKDAAMLLRGIWCQEFAELEGMTRTDASTLKAFCSRAVDRQRDPYNRVAEAVPRRVVFAGTCNETGYLKDSTGARRFWPLTVRSPIDVAKIVADRDQLWAEAAHMEAQGVCHVLPRELWAIAAERQAEQTSEDPWADKLRAFLAGGGVDMFDDKPQPARTRVHTSDLFTAIGISTADQTKDKAQRIRVVMEHAIGGWRHAGLVRIGESVARGYLRNEDL